jgi:hypothetical protein
MRRYPLEFLACLVACALVAGCNGPSSDTATKKLVAGCANSDVNSKAILYFGPSNHIGPGSVWSRLGPNGGYQPQWRVEDLAIDKSVIDAGSVFACALAQDSKFTASGGLSVLSDVANISADVKSDFSKAKSIKVSSSGAAWDTVVAGPYMVKVAAIADPNIRKDIAAANRLVLRRALRLDGYKAVLDFDTSVSPEIKAKYAGKLLGVATVGDVGAQLAAAWTNDDKLELTATDGVYVAGEFVELVQGQWVSTRGAESIEDLGDKRVLPYRPK